MKPSRREPLPLLLSIAIHVVVAFAILNAAFHYDFSGLGSPATAPPSAEKVAYVNVAPTAGATGGRDSVGPAPKASQSSRGLVAPTPVPPATAPPTPSTPGHPAHAAEWRAAGVDAEPRRRVVAPCGGPGAVVQANGRERGVTRVVHGAPVEPGPASTITRDGERL